LPLFQQAFALGHCGNVGCRDVRFKNAQMPGGQPMFHVRGSWVAAIAAGLALLCVGCPSKPTQETTTPAVRKPSSKVVQNAKSSQKAETSPDSHLPKRQSLPLIPKVELSKDVLAGSLLKVGDSMPSATCPALLGGTYSLKDLYGTELTVVCFWSVTTSDAKQSTAKVMPEAKRATDEALKFLLKEIAEPFSPKGGGVHVIDINVGDRLEDIKQVSLTFAGGGSSQTTNFSGGKLAAPSVVNDAPATMRKNGDGTETPVAYNDARYDMLPCLLDPHGELFNKVAKDGKMPRVYLLDAKGKVLWFDAGFSRPARENLLRAVRTILARN
jgi:hypothetical protein